MTSFQRISQVKSKSGISIAHMTNEQFQEMQIAPTETIPQNTFRIVDIRGEQYGSGNGNVEYTGIFPIIVTSATALYYQNKILNSESLDECFSILDLSEGIEMSTKWFRQSDKGNEVYKQEQSRIVASISQKVNFDTSSNRFHRADTFQDRKSVV